MVTRASMDALDAAVARWALMPDGAAFETRNSALLPVRRDGMPAMLKIARVAEEACGGALLEWWKGCGAACVIARDGDALLLERAIGRESLAAMALDDRDEEAVRVICDVAARLHAQRDAPPATLVPLGRWFAALDRVPTDGSVIGRAAATARQLLDDPRDEVVLHGDLHHGNVLNFGRERGWLAIDPKGLIGERAFDFANVFCNPTPGVALARLTRRVDVVADAARLDRRRLLQWVLAYAGLSAAWSIDDGEDATTAFGVAQLAAAALSA